MVKDLIIQCPKCHQVCELFLSSNAAVVILNCPHCWTPIISNNTGVYVLAKSQLKMIKSTRSTDTAIIKLLDKIEKKKSACCPQANTVKLSSKYTLLQGASYCNNAIGTERPCIGVDDITNLRISLETCGDVQEFINQL